MSTAHSAGYRARLLAFLADATYDYPWAFVLGGVALAIVSLAVAQAGLGFETSRNALISPDKQYLRAYDEYKEEFGQRDEVVIAVEDADLRRAKRFASAVAQRLEADPAAARKVFYRVDPGAFGGKALMYLKPEDIDQLRHKLIDHGDVIAAIGADPTLEALLRQINREIAKAMVGHLVSSLLGTDDGDEVQGVFDLSLLQSLLDAVGAAARGEPPPPVWRSALRPGSAMDEDGYLVDDNRRLLFVLVQMPEDTTRLAGSAAALSRLRDHVAVVRADFPGLEVGITGGPALETEEMQVTVQDMRVASILSLLGVGICFVLFYRELARPLLAVFTLLLGLAWSFGFITLAIGHLTVLSVAFATILIGMSDDFGVHLISRFEEELGHGLDEREALRRTFVNAGGGIIAGAVTFAIAFLAMSLTDFRGMAELGVIGGAGMFLCLGGMLTVFPASLVLYERLKASAPGRRLQSLIQRLPRARPRGLGLTLAGLYRRPTAALLVAAGLTAASLLAVPRIGLDLNLLNLQAEGTESVEWEHRLLKEGRRSSRYAVSLANTLEEARRLERGYEELPEVSRVESAASLVPDQQEARMEAVRALAPLAAQLPEVEPPSTDVDVGAVHELLQAIRFKLQDPKKRWDPARKPNEEALARVRETLAAVEPLLAQRDAPGLARNLGELQRRTFEDLADEIAFLRDNVTAEPITLESLPAFLRERFIGKSGRFLVQVFPEHDIWEPVRLEEFVGAVRRVDPNVTGAPVTFFETSRIMRDGYIEAGIYALIAIAILVLYDFRDLRLALLSLVPLAVGAVWTLGAMGLLGLQFNLANLIILPLIIGIGVSSGIHILHRHLEEGADPATVMSRSTGRAVILSSLTTALGFGALAVARHQGIHSLGLLLAVGVACNLLAAVMVLPALLPRTSPRDPPPGC